MVLAMRLLRAVAEASARTGRRIHMHCLETRYQRDWADREIPDGIIRYLDSIGFLSPRLTLAHCTWARPDELELLAERGVTISVNTSSNLGIRSGIAPLAEMKRRGCRVAFGIDGLALDEDDDSLREMRLTHLLHGGWGFEVDVSRADILTSAWRNGRFSVLNRDDGGQLAEGAPADLHPAGLGAASTTTGSNPISIRAICCSRASTARHIEEVIVGGRTIVKEGHVTGIDYPAMREDLLARFRAGIARQCRACGGAAGAGEGDRGEFRRRHPLLLRRVRCRLPRFIAFPRTVPTMRAASRAPSSTAGSTRAA